MEEKTTTAFPRRMLRAILHPIVLLIHFGLIAVAVATVAPFFTGQIPALAALETFAPQLAAAGILFGLLGVLFRPRLLALLGPISAAWNILLLWPYFPLASIPGIGAWASGAAAEAGPALPDGGQPGSAPLKVVSINVWYRNDDYAPTMNYLLRRDADVIGLVEVTPQWLAALEPLYRRYPYRIDCMDRMPPCEIMLLSKLPFLHHFAGRVDGRSPTVVWGEIQWQGRPVTVAETHFAWPLLAARSNAGATAAGTLQSAPLMGSDPLVQSQQARNLAQYLAALGPDLVLMGDFNSAPWSRTQEAFRTATGLTDPAPVVATWPSWGPFWMELPIDHILVRGALLRTGFRAGDYVGSDHLPVEAEIALKP